MKLLLVTHYYASHRGGVEILADTIARGLAERHGVDVTWAAGNCDAPSYPPLPLGERAGVRGERAGASDRASAQDENGSTGTLAPHPNPLPGGERGSIHAVPIPVCNFTEARLGFPYPLWWNPLSLVKVWKLLGQCDAVHLHDILYHGNVKTFLLAKLRGKPVLLTQHVSLVPYRNPVLRYGMSLANTVLGNVVYRFADRVILYSEQVRQYFGPMRTRPIELVPNGIDTDTFSPDGSESRSRLRETLDLPRNAPVALFVGRFVEKKGLKILERVVAEHPEVTFVFCGWGPLDPETWGRPNVRVVRDRKSHELVPWYRAADVFVLPSVGEGFPVVVQEAMASGLPVLISTATADAQPAVKDAVFHEELRGDAAADAKRVGDRLASLLADPAALEARRAVVADVARREWSWPRCIDRYAAILREMVMETRR